MSSGGAFNASADALRGWYDEEIGLHNFAVAGFQGPSGHMTQVC